MKNIFMFILMVNLFCGFNLFSVDRVMVNEDVSINEFNELLDAISFIESNNRNTVIGDNGKSVGRFQISKAYIDDVNRFLKNKKIRYSYEDRNDPIKSREIVRVYLIEYGKHYSKVTGKIPSIEVYARIHNGGPSGWKKSATNVYVKKIKSFIEKKV